MDDVTKGYLLFLRDEHPCCCIGCLLLLFVIAIGLCSLPIALGIIIAQQFIS